jgi:histidinol phosphatase-like PHP family hydrolase
MYDLHTHTFLSDGVLCASELVRRYADAGYKGVAITDHVDASNLAAVVPQIVSFVNETQQYMPNITLLPGCELTHVPPKMIPVLVEKARSLGAQFVIVHGETIVEPVFPGTNRAAIDAGADLIAHPGLITDEDAEYAARKNVALEITSRGGHSYTNGHVVKQARAYTATLVYASDFHEPANLLREQFVHAVLRGAGLDDAESAKVLANTQELFYNKMKIAK